MKIRFKGLAKLLKAIPNRAHLFPVKVLVNGKNKSFYAIRYKTGNKAMEIVLKQMRIPNDREALFDSKDGKAKNLSEKDVLNIYEKAGKPGSLNEFIQANFKKPIVKPRNSSTVDLDSKQMSIDDLINPAEEKNKKERYIKELKSKELKHDYKKARYVADESGEVLWRETELKYNLAITYDNKISEMTSKGQLDNLKAKTSEELEKELSDCRRLKELLGKGYSDNRKLNAEYWTKAIENGVRNLDDLLKFDEDFRNGKYDNKQQEEIQDQEPQEDMDQYISYYKKENHEVDIANLGALRLGTEEEKKAANYERNSLANKFNNEINYMKNNVDSSVNKESLINDYNRHNKLEDIFKNRKDTSYWLGLKDKVHDLMDLLAYEEKYKDGQQENQKTPEQQDKELKDKRAKQQSKEMQFERELIDEGDYGKIRKFGTKKIISKGEYPKAKNLDDFVKRTKAVKDFHLDIKGRAILDMFGIEAPLFNKRNGRPLSLDRYTKVSGYCSKNAEGETLEIALVAETGDNVRETKTTIHECMHSKLRNSISEAMEGLKFKNYIAGENIRGYIEETIVEMAGQGVSNLIHGNETDKQRWSYEGIVARAIPAILGVPEFKGARKNGLHGIGQEICKNLMSGNREFIQNVVNRYIENPEISKYIKTPIENKSGDMIEKRMKAIETKVLERTDKVEKIKNDTRRSGIANLVEELKRGTISLEGALNSEKYKEIAAILITKFLEDEDLETLEGLALSF